MIRGGAWCRKRCWQYSTTFLFSFVQCLETLYYKKKQAETKTWQYNIIYIYIYTRVKFSFILARDVCRTRSAELPGSSNRCIITIKLLFAELQFLPQVRPPKENFGLAILAAAMLLLYDVRFRFETAKFRPDIAAEEIDQWEYRGRLNFLKKWVNEVLLGVL